MKLLCNVKKIFILPNGTKVQTPKIIANNKMPGILPISIPKCHISFNITEYHLKFSLENEVMLYIYVEHPQITEAREAVNANTEK